MLSLAEYFSLEKEDIPYQVDYTFIIQYQQNNKSNKVYSIKYFHETGKKYSLICREHKIVIPKLPEKQIVEYYHNASCHPGEIYLWFNISNEKTYVKQYMNFALNAKLDTECCHLRK